MKPHEETHVIDGATVRLTRVPVRRYDWDHRQPRKGEPHGHPKEQALYEIYLNDVLIGMASRPFGFGKQGFKIERLGADLPFSYAMGDVIRYGAGYLEKGRRLDDLEQVARKAVELSNEVYIGGLKRLAPLSALEAAHAVDIAERERRDNEARENREKWRLEAIEKTRQNEERRLEILGGLESIDERFGSQLTNYEANALRIAIENWRK